MNKLKLAVAALVIAAGTFGAFAFSNASEEKESAVLNVYHYEGVDANGDILFAPGEPNPGDCTTGSIPCRFESTQTLISPMSSADIQDKATVTDWRP